MLKGFNTFASAKKVRIQLVLQLSLSVGAVSRLLIDLDVQIPMIRLSAISDIEPTNAELRREDL